MFSSGIVLIRYEDTFFNLLRQFTKDPYDAVGIKCGKTFTVLNIYDGRKPKWWKKCNFEEFKENPFVASLMVYSIKSTHVSTLRLKMALSSVISKFSEKKKDLKSFLEGVFLTHEVFEERVGYLFVCKVLESIEDKPIRKIEDSTVLSILYDFFPEKKRQVKSLYKGEIKNFFVYLCQLYLAHDEIRFSTSADSSPELIIREIQDYISEKILSQGKESPILEIDELVQSINKLAGIYHIPELECPDLEPRGMVVCVTNKDEIKLDCLPQDKKYSYLTADGMGIEELTNSQLFEIRRILDSMVEFRIEFYDLHNKINEKLSKRKKF